MSYLQNHQGRLTAPYARFGLGMLLIILAVIVLWFNEGAMDVAKVARNSIALSAGQVAARTGRRLVSVSGQLTTGEQIGDPQFLRPGPYIKLVRKVEMFCWREKRDNKNYLYEKTWLAQPPDTRRFHDKRGHENPFLPINPASYLTAAAKIGAFTIDPLMMEFPAPAALLLAPDQVTLGRNAVLAGKYYIFMGAGTFKKPRLGDVRISFLALPASLEVTAFGKKQNDLLAPFVTIEYKFYRTFGGDRDQAISQLPAEHKVRLWLLRVLGFLIMWLGLSRFARPAELLAKVRPELKNLGRSQLTFWLALLISLLIIVISIYSTGFWLLVVLIAAGYFIRRKYKAKK
jgi:Transmembrane protein 43